VSDPPIDEVIDTVFSSGEEPVAEVSEAPESEVASVPEPVPV
jgi:hypothetical protein